MWCSFLNWNHGYFVHSVACYQWSYRQTSDICFTILSPLDITALCDLTVVGDTGTDAVRLSVPLITAVRCTRWFNEPQRTDNRFQELVRAFSTFSFLRLKWSLSSRPRWISAWSVLTRSEPQSTCACVIFPLAGCCPALLTRIVNWVRFFWNR